MYKKIWKDDEAVSPVIATILMVAITVVLAGVLVVYMQQFSQGPGDNVPQGTFVASTFSNPYDGTTANGGGWVVKVQALSGSKPSWGEVTVTITKGGVNFAEMKGVKATVSENEHTATSPMWYLKQATGSTLNYVEGGAAVAVGGNEANIGAGEFETIQGAYLVVVDNDGDGKMTNGDVVYIYKNYNHDLTNDIESGSLAFKMSGGEIGTTNLG